MEKSNGMKISSVFLTALALLNFRVATASTGTPPPPKGITCPISKTCATFCKNFAHQINVKHYDYFKNRCYIVEPSAIYGEELVKQKNHIWQGKKLVSASVSPGVKKLLEATSRDEFRAVFNGADSASGIIVNKTTYSQLFKKGKRLGFELYPAAEVRKGWYKLGIKPDTAQVSDVSDHGDNEIYRKDER